MPKAILRSSTVNLPPLEFRAEVRPGSIDEEKRTVEVVWSTGARVLRGYYNRYYEELSLDREHVRLDRLNNGAPFLNSHQGWTLDTVMGVVVDADVDGQRGTATVRFAKAEDDEEADRVFRKIADGIVRNVSVGYHVHRFEQVEGGDEEIPVYRATDWEPFEISAVSMGADDGAGFRA
ncbi:MAG: HK97 family phage prohead protease, partial [Pseudomonadota bacterium]